MEPLHCSGVHHKKSECTTSKVVSKVQQILAKAKPYLFPTALQVKHTTPGKASWTNFESGGVFFFLATWVS